MKPLWFSLSGIELSKQKYNGKSIYILPICTVVLPIDPFSNFFIFFQFLQLQAEETYFIQDAITVSWQKWLVNINTTVKYWYSAHICCCFFSFENYSFLQRKILQFYPIFKRLIFSPSFFHFKWKKPISSRKPSQFLVLLLLEGTCKQQYNCKVFIFSTFCCCFISFENYNFLQGKIFTLSCISHFSSFFQFLPLQVEETYFFRDGLNRGSIRFLPPGGRNLPTLHDQSNLFHKFSGIIELMPNGNIMKNKSHMLLFQVPLCTWCVHHNVHWVWCCP